MKWIILVFTALLAVTLAAENKTETKDKRHTVRTRVATSPIGLANQRIGYDQGSNQQQYHVQPTASGQSSEGEEIPDEYYQLLKQFAIEEADKVQQQQLEHAMKHIIGTKGGRAEIKQYQIPNDPQPHQHQQQQQQLQQHQVRPQQAQYAIVPKGEQEQQVLTEAEYYQLLNAQSQEQAAYPKPQQQPQLQQPQHHHLQQQRPQLQKFAYQQISDESNSYESDNSQQQQHAQYLSVPQNHIKPKLAANHPLAESSLEKEIAKLESSFQPQELGQIKSQPRPQNYNIRPQQIHYQKPKPLPQQQPQHQFAYGTPGLGQYSSFKAQEEIQQKPEAAPLVAIQAEAAHYLQSPQKEAHDKQQYLSEVHRFYNQPPQRHQHQPEPNKIPFVTTERPVYEHQQPQFSSFDRSSTMKIVPAPQLQYERPKNAQQQQLYYKHQQESERLQPQIPEEIFQKTLGASAQSAPSRSAIYVSQGTGAPPVQKKKVVHHHHHLQQQQQQQQQHQQLHQLPQAQALTQHQVQQSSEEKPGQIRLPSNGRPLTQEEFQALVDAGYSVTAIPVPVPVPADEYHKLQHQQQQKRFQQQHQLQQHQQQHQQHQQQQQFQHKRQQPKQQYSSEQQSDEGIGYLRAIEQYNNRQTKQ